MYILKFIIAVGLCKKKKKLPNYFNGKGNETCRGFHALTASRAVHREAAGRIQTTEKIKDGDRKREWLHRLSSYLHLSAIFLFSGLLLFQLIMDEDSCSPPEISRLAI